MTSRVDSWLCGGGEDGEGSVVGGENVMDDACSLADGPAFEFGAEVAVDGDARAELVGVLEPLAGEVQRFGVCSLAREYVRGRMTFARDYRNDPLIPQRWMSVQQYRALASLDDEAFYDDLRKGGMVTRLGAATALGKTTKLPALIAKKCGVRVCLVVMDAVVARLAAARMAQEYGVKVSHTSSVRTKTARVTVMSYADFRGVVCSEGRRKLFQNHDVFMADEAHLRLADVYVMQQFYAVHSLEHNSLLLMSATASTEAGNNAVAQRVGKFVDMRPARTLEELIDSGDLLNRYLTDRMMLVVGSDAWVARAAAYLKEAGVDVMMMDHASMLKDYVAVEKFLSRPQVAVPRVLVAAEWFGTSYNFPVSYVVTTASRSVFNPTPEGTLVEVEEPLHEQEVLQHKARTGRGLSAGSGGVVLSPARDARPGPLIPSEALKAYLCLVAGGVRPRPSLFPSCDAMFPRGLARDVALDILSVELPPHVVVRYLASDGRFARRFIEGIKFFSQPDNGLLPSKEMDPVDFDKWITEKAGCYDGTDFGESTVDVCVPFAVPPSLRVQVHTIYAVSVKWFDVYPYRPDMVEDSSEDEGVRERAVAHGRKEFARRRVSLAEEPEQLVLPPAVPEKDWSLDTPEDLQTVRRQRKRMAWSDTQAGKRAVALLLESAEGGRTLGAAACDQREVQTEYGLSVELSEPRSPVSVHSPGGSGVMTIPRKCFDAVMSGQALSVAQFVELMEAVGGPIPAEKFACSTLFDNWTGAWLSVLRTYACEEAVRAVAARGYVSRLSRLLTCLYDRFRNEVLTVCEQSNVYRSRFAGFFMRSASITKFYRAVEEGRLRVAQSDAFIGRVLEIKAAYDAAALGVEKAGVYMPVAVTSAQRALPLRRKRRGREVRLPLVGVDVVENPGVRLER